VSDWRTFFSYGDRAGCSADQLRYYARAGIIPFPKQLEFSAAARECDREDGPNEVAYAGALGGGKSLAVIAQVGVDDCQRFPGLKVLLLRKVGRSNIENFQDLRLKAFGALPHSFAKSGHLTFKNGSRIIAGHYQNERDIDTYLGLEYDVIVIEEATTLSVQKFTHICTRNRTSKPGWRPRIYLTANPGGVGHFWFKTRFVTPHRRRAEKSTRYVHSLPSDNPWIDPGYLTRLKSLTGWERRAWLDGDWDIAAGQFFTAFRQEIHVDPMDTFDERKVREWNASLDWGVNHPCCVHLGGYDGDGNAYILDEHCLRQAHVKTHSKLIKEMLARHTVGTPGQPASWSPAGRRPMELRDLSSFAAGSDIFADESDGVSVAAQFQDEGIVLQAANMERINGWAEITKRLGDSEVEPKIQPRLFIHRRCVRLVETLPMLQHDPDHPNDVLKWDIDDQGNGGDDAPDSMRYLLATKARRLVVGRLQG
jgi:phage terminase large subunit